MRADETKRGAASRHYNARGAVTEEGRKTALREINDDRFREPISAAEMKRTAGIRRALNGCAVVTSARFKIRRERNCAERSSAPANG